MKAKRVTKYFCIRLQQYICTVLIFEVYFIWHLSFFDNYKMKMPTAEQLYGFAKNVTFCLKISISQQIYTGLISFDGKA